MRLRIIACIVFLLVLTGCSVNTDAQNTNIPIDNPEATVTGYSDPQVDAFTVRSFEELNNAVKSDNAKSDVNLKGLNYYYTPADIVDNTNASIDSIRVTARYVSQYFSIKKVDYEEFQSSGDAEVARLSNTIKLTWTRSEDGKLLLSTRIENLELKPLYEGSSYYYFDISHPSRPNEVLGKSIFWVEDGFCFNLDIPIDVYENQIQKETQEQKQQGREASEDEIKGMVVQNATAMQIKSLN